jgi:hypothetical protein
MSDDKTLVQYLGNTENYNNTGALTFAGDDREDIPVGGTGWLTDQEIANARRFGLIINPVTPASDLSKEELTSELEALGQTVKSSDTQKVLADKLTEVRESTTPSPAAGDSPVVGDAGDNVSSAVATGSTTAGPAGTTGSAS